MMDTTELLKKANEAYQKKVSQLRLDYISEGINKRLDLYSKIQELMPKAGRDFFTKEEKKSFKNEVTPEKGEDYFTEEEIDEFLDEVTPKSGEDYFTDEEKEALKQEVTPEKGEDYFTEKEIDEFLDEVTPEPGEDYFTDEEKEEFKQEVTPQKGRDYLTEEEMEKIRKDLTPQKGVDYEDGSTITKEEIKEKLEEYEHEPKEKRPDAQKIFKNLPEGNSYYLGGGGGGGGGASRFLKLLDTPEEMGNAGQIVAVNSDGNRLEFIDSEVGDIIKVTAGTGLSGGGDSGDVTLSNADRGSIAVATHESNFDHSLLHSRATVMAMNTFGF